MIYTDNIHLIADSIEELHGFAVKIGLKRCWFHNPRRKSTGSSKNHPHYDLVNKKNLPLIDSTGKRYMDKAIEQGAKLVSDRQLIGFIQAWGRSKRTGKQILIDQLK